MPLDKPIWWISLPLFPCLCSTGNFLCQQNLKDLYVISSNFFLSKMFLCWHLFLTFQASVPPYVPVVTCVHICGVESLFSGSSMACDVFLMDFVVVFILHGMIQDNWPVVLFLIFPDSKIASSMRGFVLFWFWGIKLRLLTAGICVWFMCINLWYFSDRSTNHAIGTTLHNLKSNRDFLGLA